MPDRWFDAGATDGRRMGGSLESDQGGIAPRVWRRSENIFTLNVVITQLTTITSKFEMAAALHTLSFPGAITERGFWLYVWKVETPKGAFLYVGRTGDNSSPYASAPYTRMGQHLGSTKTQNALRQHLKKMGLEPKDYERFDLVCFGPLFYEASGPEMDRAGLMIKHTPIRNIVGALDKTLAEELLKAGYAVLNGVKWKHPTDLALWATVKSAFSADFPLLRTTSD